MTLEQFRSSLALDAPPSELPVTLAALWYDAKGDGERAHALVDELETKDGMAVHAYVHRKQGAASNAEYWYERAGREHFHPDFQDEWQALVEYLLTR